MPTDERGCELESRGSGGIIVCHAPMRHSSELRHSSFGIGARLLFIWIRVIRGYQAPLFDFSCSAALISARIPSGFLSFGSTGRLLMNSVGVTFIPKESAS